MKAATADITGAAIADGKRKTDRDRGVHRIAAHVANFDADARRLRLLRHHHAVMRGDAWRTGDFGVGEPRSSLRTGEGQSGGACQRQARDTKQWKTGRGLGIAWIENATYSIDGKTGRAGDGRP